jgi:hypothetical protein
MSNVVWNSKLDNRYNCEVKRISDYKGQLTVLDEENGELILNEEVGLSYGSMFGPDIADLQLWQDMIIKAVDNP